MLTYNTSLQNTPPYDDAQRADALKALAVRSPYGKFGSTHQDLLNAYGGSNAAQFDLASTKADTDYTLAKQQAERQLVLQGLQQVGQAQQNNQNLQNSRLQAMYGTASSLLGGLFS